MTAITNGTPKQIAWAHDIRASARRLRAFAESELPIASRRARVLVPAVLGAIRWDAPDAAGRAHDCTNIRSAREFMGHTDMPLPEVRRTLAAQYRAHDIRWERWPAP